MCTGDIIHFTCTAEANPAIHTYVLYGNDSATKNMGISGAWIKPMDDAGRFVFRCEANNSVRDIGKSGDTMLSVDGEFKIIILSCIFIARHFLRNIVYPVTQKD